MQRGFIANFSASCTGVSCPAPHTIKTKADLNSLTAAVLYRDIKKNGVGIVYNTGSSGYLSTENTARTQKSAERYSLAYTYPNPTVQGQFLKTKTMKVNLSLWSFLRIITNFLLFTSGAYMILQRSSFRPNARSHEAMEQGLIFTSHAKQIPCIPQKYNHKAVTSGTPGM